MVQGRSFDKNVFINCPFDARYAPILQGILFCLIRFGLNPRIATERSDSGESRIDKILELVESSRYSIHDLSRCQARYEDLQEWHYERHILDGFSEDDIQDYPTAELMHSMQQWMDSGSLSI